VAGTNIVNQHEISIFKVKKVLPGCEVARLVWWYSCYKIETINFLFTLFWQEGNDIIIKFYCETDSQTNFYSGPGRGMWVQPTL
jgi:hypothetical protein